VGIVHILLQFLEFIFLLFISYFLNLRYLEAIFWLVLVWFFLGFPGGILIFWLVLGSGGDGFFFEIHFFFGGDFKEEILF